MTGVIVHEWLERHGGAEKVVEEFAALYPEADVHALWNDVPGRFAAGRVRETWLAHTPLRKRKSLALPFMLPTWRSLGSSEADWMLCSSHLFAHHAKFSGPAASADKYVYAYTPARYIWNPELDTRGNSAIAKALSKPLQYLDRKRAREAKSVAAISNYVKSRIEQHWDRECKVIYPPVNVDYFRASRMSELSGWELEVLESLPEHYILGASRFIPYKRLDLVISAGAAVGLPVVLAGGGPDEHLLRTAGRDAAVRVDFVGTPSQALLRELYARATVFVFPAVEDFGIMPVEAMACGTPVIASAFGGAAETVVHAVTGALVESFDAESIRSALNIVSAVKAEDCISRAEIFNTSTFREKIKEWIGE